MQRYFAVSVGVMVSFLTWGSTAQVASGNVAESAHPRADVMQAQNPRIHRTVQGCLSQVGTEYRLLAKHLGPIQLRASDGETLGPHLGQRVKVRGNLAPLTLQEADTEQAAGAAKSLREMTVERIDRVSGTCLAGSERQGKI